MPNIVPVSDLRNYPEVLRNVTKEQPVYLTKNGRGSYVLMDIEFPESGAPLEPHINLDSPYRFITAGNYIAFYRFEENTVYVDRVLYQKRNYAKLLSL